MKERHKFSTAEVMFDKKVCLNYPPNIAIDFTQLLCQSNLISMYYEGNDRQSYLKLNRSGEMSSRWSLSSSSF